MINIKEAIDKSVFFLGAGSSYDANCKMSGAMLADIEEKISTPLDETFAPVEKETLQFLLACLEYQSKWRSLETNNKFVFTPNIEELGLVIRRIKNRENFLPYPITGNWSDKLINLESKLNEEVNNLTLYESIERKIKNILIPQWLKHSTTDFLFPLGILFENNPNEDFKLDIVSLNYDLVIEDYFESRQMRPWRGFSNSIWCGMTSDVPNDFGRVHLYKLHGSLDWLRLTSGEVREKENLSNDEKGYVDINHDPYIIFGHGTKTFSVDPFFSIIHDFKKLLKERDYIFVIGYSFFDPYINNLLLEAINNYGSKKIIIVNPFLGPESLYKTLKKNVLKENFFEGQDESKNSNTKLLIDFIETIQKNSFYSEVPEFNISKINGEKPIFYIPLGTKEFLSEFFSENAKLFISLIQQFEGITKEDEEPF